VVPPPDACELALRAAAAVGGALVGIDLVPADVGTWVVLEVNGAVDFNATYTLGNDVYADAIDALRGVVEEPATALAAQPAGLDVLAQ
jgi:glutathione synthase/RimK-type ligase-like ATP-grasp enzyme